MGGFLDKPKTEKEYEEGSGNGLHYALSSMQGWRQEMEDAHTALPTLSSMPAWSFFAVFDGHASDKVAIEASRKLLINILNGEDWANKSQIDIQRSVRLGFLNMDAKLRLLPDLSSGEGKGGSTCVSVLISNDSYYFANLGDSRALLVRGGAVHFATADHKPNQPVERVRIEAAGGEVVMDRVNGELAVSRALGDFEYKCVSHKGACQQLVSPEPDVTHVSRDVKDEILVLACDGVWDVMSNEEVAGFLLHRMRLTSDLKLVCSQLLDTCLHKGSRDNMSLIVVALGSAPVVCEHARTEDCELNHQLEQAVTNFVQESETPTSVEQVMEKLSQKEDLEFPPGGAHAKYDVIKKAFEKLVPYCED